MEIVGTPQLDAQHGRQPTATQLLLISMTTGYVRNPSPLSLTHSIPYSSQKLPKS